MAGPTLSSRGTRRHIAIAAVVLGTLACVAWAPSAALATWSGAVSGNTGTLTHDNTADEPLTIFSFGEFDVLHHSGTNNAGFEGEIDFDSTTPGVQTVQNSSTMGALNIIGGNAPDHVTIGNGTNPAGRIQAPISFNGGEPNLDLLSFVGDSDLTGRTVTVSGSLVSFGFAPQITDQNVERLQFGFGDGDDALTVGSGAPAVEDVRLRGGGDIVVPADGVGVGTVNGIQGGAGTDTLEYGPWTTPVSVVSGPVDPSGEVTAEATGTAGVTGFENFNGGQAADQLVGNHLANRLAGGSGNDDLTGGAGQDTMLGGADDDHLRAQDGEADAAIDCGDGTGDVADRDLASIDPDGILSGCETVNTPTPPPPPPGGGGGGGGNADETAPETSLDAGPKPKIKLKKKKKKKAKVTFEFSSEPGASFECSLDEAPFAACTSPHVEKVKKGRHAFDVRAVDAAGNVDQTPAERSFKVKRKKKK
jgi:RTX calcium-binding nonapeptide repeat (4 copies)